MTKNILCIGYAMFESPNEEMNHELNHLKKRGCHKIYKDIVPSLDSKRPGLSNLILEIGYGNGVDIYCLSIVKILSTVNSFIPLAELIKEKEARLIFIEDEITLTKENLNEVILIWKDLLHFKYKFKSRRAGKITNWRNNKLYDR